MVLPNTRYRTQRKYSAFARQRMNKVGDHAPGYGWYAWHRVPNWASDATYPATVVVGTTQSGLSDSGSVLVVQGSAASVMHRAYIVPVRPNQWYHAYYRLVKNGVVLAEVTKDGTGTAADDVPFEMTYVGPVAAGDSIEVHFSHQETGGGVKAGSYVEVVAS